MTPIRSRSGTYPQNSAATAQPTRSPDRRRRSPGTNFLKSTVMIRIWLVCLAVLAALGVMVWADDAITLQGERTVYTAGCQQGVWAGQRCSGKLVAGERYKFRALKARREVLFWSVGVDEPSGRFTECLIQDGRNWSCKPSADAARTITREMVHGWPVADASGLARPLHAMTKWRWWLLRWGFQLGDEASA